MSVWQGFLQGPSRRNRAEGSGISRPARHPLQLWSFVWGFPRTGASSSCICKFLLCTRYSNKNTAKWHQFANPSLHPTGLMLIEKSPERTAKTKALGGQFGVSHLASLGLCFPIWHTVGKGISPILSASLGDGLQLSHPQALSWPCQPLSQCPLPQGLVEQCPSQSTGFLGVLGVGALLPGSHLRNLWATITHLYSCLLNHRKCSSWVCPVSPASAITLLTTHKSQEIRVDLQGHEKQTFIPALLWIPFVARFTFACVSVSNLRIAKNQQIRARRRALILAFLVSIHLIGEDWEARGERMLLTIPKNCKFISSTYEKYFSHNLSYQSLLLSLSTQSDLLFIWRVMGTSRNTIQSTGK